jgi:hypothetical protein
MSKTGFKVCLSNATCSATIRGKEEAIVMNIGNDAKFKDIIAGMRKSLGRAPHVVYSTDPPTSTSRLIG